jgi:hypothetical protein
MSWIMQQLGYKRLPNDFSAFCVKAEERVGRYLADQASMVYEDYRWSMTDGTFKAEKLN